MTDTLESARLKVMEAVPFIRKSRAPELKYTYASERELIKRLRPAMVENGLTVAPIGVTVAESGSYETAKGSKMLRMVLVVTYRMTHAPSKESLDIQVVGEASDTSDKASSKAMTMAYKYMLRQTFGVETGDDPDNPRNMPRDSGRREAAEQNAKLDMEKIQQRVLACNGDPRGLNQVIKDIHVKDSGYSAEEVKQVEEWVRQSRKQQPA